MREAPPARESNGVAARRGLWEALDTLHCGKPQVLREFFASTPPGQRIVDVGCWNGSVATLAAESIDAAEDPPWRSYVGIDIVPEAIARFKTVHGHRVGIGARAGDVRALPIDDGQADVVLCLFVLQDLASRDEGEQALSELARIARPGAHALVGLTVHSTHDEETSYVVRALRSEGVPEKLTYHWRREDFLDAVRARGFRLVQLDEFGPNDRGFVELYLQLVRCNGNEDGDPS